MLGGVFEAERENSLLRSAESPSERFCMGGSLFTMLSSSFCRPSRHFVGRSPVENGGGVTGSSERVGGVCAGFGGGMGWLIGCANAGVLTNGSIG